jgi:GNAT superfamily N-acetyltransferase
MTATTTPVPNRGNQADRTPLDGTVGAVRPVDRSDLEALLELHDGLGEDALRLRFFGISRIVPQRYVDHVLGGVESDAVLGLGLWQHGRLLGVATAELDGPGRAEVAFLVADDQHGRGIGTILLEHLAAVARRRGIGTFTADVLVDNTLMLRVMKDAGFEVSRQLDGGVVTVQMRITQNAGHWRLRTPARPWPKPPPSDPSQSPLRRGRRRTPTAPGRAAILEAILDGEFSGDVSVVHPRAAAPRRSPPTAPSTTYLGHSTCGRRRSRSRCRPVEAVAAGGAPLSSSPRASPSWENAGSPAAD